MRGVEGSFRGAVTGIALAAGLVLPAACFFPEYTFDLGKGGGGATTTSSTTSTTSTSGTGGVTTTSTTSTGGGGTVTTSTSSSGTVETCASGDCSDPACQAVGYSCAPSVPAGWMGYFVLYDGATTGYSGCPGYFSTSSYLGNNQINAAQPTCSTCDCGKPQGEACRVTGSPDAQYPGTVDSIFVVDSACTASPNCGANLEVSPTWDGSCYGPDGVTSTSTCGVNSGAQCNLGSSPCNVSVQMLPLQVAAGTCTPTPQTPTIEPISWNGVGEACSAAAATDLGCNPGAVCLPKPPAPFHGLCIYQDGDASTCPPGQFSKKHLFYGGATDGRKCSDCSCGASAGASCSAQVTIYSDTTKNTCSHAVATLNVSTSGGDCQPLTGNPAAVARKAVFTTPTGGGCAASGGQPSGTATPTTPRTYCCQN